MEGYPDFPQQDIFARIFELHRRQSRIVLDVMIKAISEHAGDLAARLLSPYSLLVMHMGQGAQAAASLAIEASPANVIEEISDADATSSHDPGAPPVLQFRHDNGKYEVSVRGLCNLLGNPARVMHHLKMPFEEDRAAGLAYEGHRFVSISGLKGVTMSKDNIRTALKLCRKTVEEAHMVSHQISAPQDFLIQTGPSRRHRLNPRAQIMTDSNPEAGSPNASHL